jgi:hypothetical protein
MAGEKPEPGWKKAEAVGSRKDETQPLYQKVSPSRQFLIEVINTLTEPGWKRRISSQTRLFFAYRLRSDVRNRSRSLSDLKFVCDPIKDATAL